MATKVLMEALSPTMEEGRVVKWLKNEGDTVKSGETIAEVETDKAIMDLVARGDGVMRKRIAPEGATVEVGKLVAVIGTADEDISSFGDEKRETKDEKPKTKDEKKEPTDEKRETRDEKRETKDEKRETRDEGRETGRVKASPLARRMAQESGVDLGSLEGSGPGGRIIKRDIESSSPVSRPSPLVSRPSSASEGAPYRDVPLTQIRKTIAKRLTHSLAPVPHFFLTTEIDMERAWDAREALNRIGDEQRVSFNDIIIKVVALALTRHPECNAWWRDDHIRYFADVHMGMAVAVEDGLITPVIRDAQGKSLRDIAAESRDLVERARARRLKPEEYTGATFSVSNLGMFDIDHFTAIINPPEAGILAVGSIAPQAVVHEGQLVVRRRMRVTMSCDHRVIDGATGAKFLQTVRRMLENPLAMVW